jgi:hypothetical protein
VLKELFDARHVGGGHGNDEEEMLWVGPLFFFSAPMDVRSRDKHLKFKEVRRVG